MKLFKWFSLNIFKNKSFNSSTAYKIALLEANTARDQKNWTKAAHGYRLALSLNSRSVHLYVQLGHMFKEYGDYTNSKIEYEKYAVLYPQDSDIHLQLGHLLNKQGKIVEALQKYEYAKSLDPSNREILKHIKRFNTQSNFGLDVELRNQALNLTDVKNWDSAYLLLVDLVDQKGHYDLNTILGNVCKERGDFAEAFRRYDLAQGSALAENNISALMDIHMQIGHFYKIDRKPVDALKKYICTKNIALKHGSDKNYNEACREIRSVKREITTLFD